MTIIVRLLTFPPGWQIGTQMGEEVSSLRGAEEAAGAGSAAQPMPF